jgi:dCMP deaminase
LMAKSNSQMAKSPKEDSEHNRRVRVGWDEYFMKIAHEVATRATCDRKHIGALIVRDKVILSTGYNGSMRGMPHCDEVGHEMENGHCVRTVHAEMNALVQAAKNGIAIDNGTLYTTASPCWICFKMLVNAGIKKIVYGEHYRETRIFDASQKLNIWLVDLSVYRELLEKNNPS